VNRVLAVLTFLFYIVTCLLSGQQLEIHFLNVGQGDAAIVQEGGHTTIIDAGPSGISAFLTTLHIDTIDLVVASHPHADHIGGMPELLQSHVVRFHLDNGIPHATAIYRRTLDAVRASGAQYLNATSRTITLGAAQLHVLAPPPNTTINNGSVGILIEYLKGARSREQFAPCSLLAAPSILVERGHRSAGRGAPAEGSEADAG
jgi:beta-lactamase superfamily II metal-dependent hydrolase